MTTKVIALDAGRRAELIAMYSDELMTLARDFIADNGLTDMMSAQRRDAFPGFVRMARKQLVSIPRDLILLDALFDVFLDICTLFNYSANVYMFADLVSIDSSIWDWEHSYVKANSVHYALMDGRIVNLYPADIVKTWHKKCGAFLAAQLQNTDGTSVNRIFISKAVYGLRDDGPTGDAGRDDSIIDADSLPTLPG